MKKMNLFRLTSLLGLLALTISCTQRWEITEDENGILLAEDGRKVFFYQKAPKSYQGKSERCNYIHPLYGVNEQILTQDFPLDTHTDHLHQRGVYWAWHQIYIGTKRIGDAWINADFEWDITWTNVQKHIDSCVIAATVLWKSPLWLDQQGVKKAFAREDISFKVHPAEDNFRVLDFSIQITALEDSLFIGGSEDDKGYGGFSIRLDPGDGLSFKNASGSVEAQRTALDAGPWMNIIGNWDEELSDEGVIMISHPDNPGHPQPWIIRTEKSMQNAMYPGRFPVMIPPEKPLRLKYRVIVYQGLIGDKIQQLLEP
jgi:hypothetical protein